MAKTKGGKLGTIARQAGQGATFGFSDEIVDILAAIGAGAVSSDLTIEEALKEARRMSKEELGADWKNAPVTSFISQVAGGVPMGLTKGAASAANWIRGGSTLQGIGKGAAIGAGYGGLAGLGAADDTLSSRVSGAAVGAGTGGLVGGATAPLARMGTPPDAVDFRKVVNKTEKVATGKAEKDLARKLAARPDLVDQLSRAEAMDAAAKRQGINLTLAEKIARSQSDPLLADQKILSQNPMTAGVMEDLYAARSGTPNQAGQIENALMARAGELSGGMESYDDVAAALIDKSQKSASKITQDLVAQANPLYKAAYGVDVDPNEFAQLVQKQPIVANAIKQAINDERFSAQLMGKNPNSVEVLDAAKRIIGEKIRAGANPMQPFDTRAYKAAQDQLLGLADKYAPEYAQARGVYSGQPEQLAMRARIGAVADIDPLQSKQVADKLFSGTQKNAELAAQALGPEGAKQAAAARILNVMETGRGDPTSFASKIAPDARTMDMVRTYTGDNSLDEIMNVINQAKIGEKFRYGSPTQPLEQANRGLQDAAGAGIDLAVGNNVGLLRKVAGMFGRSQEQDPQFFADMADLMTTDKGMDLLRRVSQGQMTAIQQLKAVSPVLSLPAAATSQSPITRAAVGGVMAPQGQEQPQIMAQPQAADDFSDIDAILNMPQQSQPVMTPAQPVDDFKDIEQILNEQQSQITPQENQDINRQMSESGQPSFLDRVAMAESGGNPNAKAKTSSASGLYQFTDPTWRGMVNKYGAETGITINDKAKPDKQKIMAELLTKENTDAYTRAGIQPDDADLYMAHFLGAPSAVKARKNMDAYAAAMFPDAAEANKSIFYANGKPRKVSEVRQLLAKKIGA